MPPAQHQRGRRFRDACNQLGKAQACLHIPAHRIENYQQALDGGVFLHSHQLRDDMLVFCCFLALRRKRMALYLPNHRKAVDGMFAPGREHAAHLHQIFLLGAQFFRRFVLFVLHAVFLHGTFLPFVVAAPCSVGPGAPVYAQFGPRKA